jgi:hypothetical protein
MKVSELIADLQQFDMDSPVHFAYNYGDHWRTQVAPGINNVTEGMVVYSDYHSMDKLAKFDDTEGARPVVVLS